MAKESRDAFDSLDPDEISRQEQLVVAAIRTRPNTNDGGPTCDEAEVLTGLPHQSCSARFTGLKDKGRIVWRHDPEKPGNTPLRRPTRSGRGARVWWLASEQEDSSDA